MKIDEWRAALKHGLEAGALPPFEEEVTYTKIPTRVVKCKLVYDTDLGRSDAPFRLAINLSWTI